MKPALCGDCGRSLCSCCHHLCTYVTIYRIEHVKTARGPYNHGDIPDSDADGVMVARYDCEDRREQTHEHPTPSEDGIYDFERGVHYSGFASMEDLLAWFDQEFLDDVRPHGFHVRKYKVHEDHVLVGHTQVAFERDHATYIN